MFPATPTGSAVNRAFGGLWLARASLPSQLTVENLYNRLQIVGVMLQKTSWQFILFTRELWKALYADCAAARESIQMDQYILADDEEGRRFLSLFCEKAAEGKKVLLMLDKIGSRSVFYSKWPEKLRKAGATVEFFNPVSWRDLLFPRRWFPRDHCKTAFIDGKIAYLGSTCINSSMGNWRDTHLRLKGALTAQFSKAFSQLWKHPSEAEYQSVTKEGLRLIMGRAKQTHFYKELLSRLKNAKEEIYLVGPYFMPSIRFRHIIKAAARHGVKVNVIVSGPTDVLLADCIAQSYFRTLLKAGIKIFVYQQTVLHAKYMIIDDEWATVGSMNFDYLSFFQNRESGLAVTDPKMVAELKSHVLGTVNKPQV